MDYIINGRECPATEFGFDGCHKIYVCDTEEGRAKLVELGYDLYPMEVLPEVWTSTCSLRFIQSGDLERTYVSQCEPASFEGWRLGGRLKSDLEFMAREQREANGEEGVWDEPW